MGVPSTPILAHSRATQFVAGTAAATALTGMLARLISMRYKKHTPDAYKGALLRRVSRTLWHMTLPQLVALASLLVYEHRHALTTDDNRASDVTVDVDDKTPEVKVVDEQEERWAKEDEKYRKKQEYERLTDYQKLKYKMAQSRFGQWYHKWRSDRATHLDPATLQTAEVEEGREPKQSFVKQTKAKADKIKERFNTWRAKRKQRKKEGYATDTYVVVPQG